LKFTLTYEGSLRDKVNRIRSLRRIFHQQLKRLWTVNSLLNNWSIGGTDAISYLRINTARIGEFEYVPLVTKALCVECALDFRILRSTEKPGNQSDIDNQIGVFFDALKRPQDGSQLGKEGGARIVPKDDEKPFFVLVDDDKLITKMSSVSDELLYPVNGGSSIDPNDVRVTIDVYIRPVFPRPDNVLFFSEDRGVWNHKYDEAIPERLSDLSDSQLAAVATQCVFRIHAMAESFVSWKRISAPEAGTWAEDTQRMLDDSNLMLNLWRSELQPKAFAVKREMNRRIYGEPPYPTARYSHVIDSGSLAGAGALTGAAIELTELIRKLSA
jgi:hypothetical protein